MVPPKVATANHASESREPSSTPPATVPADAEDIALEVSSQPPTPDNIDDIFAALKTLLSTVEKLQKARQEVGDIKPLLVRMLDGEMLSGDELDQLKAGVNGLSRLVRFYDDYQSALAKAQPAKDLLDVVLKP